MRNELLDSYVWLMETFLEAMNGLAPKCIITDQDFAMRGAIDKVFPDAIHRNCRWHVMQNCTEKMGSYIATHPELKDAFNACVNNNLKEEEFEQNWQTMLEVHGEQENINLYEVYKHRDARFQLILGTPFSPSCRQQQGAKGSMQCSRDT